MNPRTVPLITSLLFCTFIAAAQAVSPGQPVGLPEKFALSPNPIELARATRPNVYFDAVGRRSAIFGHESGVFESWVFPIKLFHDARLSVSVEGQDAPVDFAACVERIIARPEATTLVASNQLFTIRAHFLSPIDEAGSIILLDIDTARPLTITVSFVPDLKPMWPGGLGGQSAGWRGDLKAFVVSESRRKFNGLFGCPAATKGAATPAHQLASGALRFDIKVDPQQAGKFFYPLIIAGGTNGRQPVVDLYNKLAASISEQYRQTFAHYRRLRDEMMSIESPDAQLNLAFEWAKVALDKGMVDNPDLGLGLVAGWGATGDGARPGFGWFFGGDAAINSYAMTGCGDFDSVRATFRFLAKYQRADGKITHEISQSAGMIKWFEEYPYAYYHADTTPFYIAAVYNYYLQSGDKELIEELWPVLKKAWQFCIDNDADGDGIIENSKAGLGASELGSLLEGLHQDIYLAATSLEASTAMLELARAMKDDQLALLALERENKAHDAINARYWNQSEGRYAYALTKNKQGEIGQNMEVTAWAAVPMMFSQLRAERVSKTLAGLASAQLSTDWGTRMLSNNSPAYDPMAYNNGGVWPFLTGFVATGEYAYHHSHSAFAHLKQVANLTFDFALGDHPEILSGDYYHPLDESVPHQLFSSGMVITPLVRGLLGLRPEAGAKQVGFAPQLPASWDRIKVRNLRVGASRLTIEARRTGYSSLRYEISKDDDEPLSLLFTPALPALAEVRRVLVDGSPVEFKALPTGVDTVCGFKLQLRRRATVEVAFDGGIEVDVPLAAPQIGDRTSSLKVLRVTTPSATGLSIHVEGLTGKSYIVRVRGGLKLATISAASLKGEQGGWQLIEIAFPADGRSQHWQGRDVIVELK
ncbi:MAG TPA: amylo-alpha-1,6-glucosidase [Blastocatellia bacterium]|nr:amylo-alpha-1,6-glucosidase [Blastocatellia bacterium]